MHPLSVFYRIANLSLVVIEPVVQNSCRCAAASADFVGSHFCPQHPPYHTDTDTRSMNPTKTNMRFENESNGNSKGE